MGRHYYLNALRLFCVLTFCTPAFAQECPDLFYRLARHAPFSDTWNRYVFWNPRTGAGIPISKRVNLSNAVRSVANVALAFTTKIVFLGGGPSYFPLQQRISPSTLQKIDVSFSSAALRPLGRELATVVPGAEFVDLGSGDRHYSSVPRAIAQKFGAASYVGVDDGQPAHGAHKGVYGDHQSDPGFRVRYENADMLSYLRSLKPSNQRRVFFIEGIQALPGDKDGKAKAYLKACMEELQRVTRPGDAILIGATVSYLSERSSRKDSMLSPTDFGFLHTFCDPSLPGGEDLNGSYDVWVKDGPGVFQAEVDKMRKLAAGKHWLTLRYKIQSLYGARSLFAGDRDALQECQRAVEAWAKDAPHEYLKVEGIGVPSPQSVRDWLSSEIGYLLRK